MTPGSDTPFGSFGSVGACGNQRSRSRPVSRNRRSPTSSAVAVAALPLATIRRIFAAVDAGFEGIVHWRGAGLDRLLDARHASLVAARVLRLKETGWDPSVEVSYSVYGERGSIDVLGARAVRQGSPRRGGQVRAREPRGDDPQARREGPTGPRAAGDGPSGLATSDGRPTTRPAGFDDRAPTGGFARHRPARGVSRSRA